MISYVSFVSLTCVILVIGASVVSSLINISDEPKTNLQYADYMNFPLFFGICVYQYEGNVGCLQIENSMKSPKQFKKASTIGLSSIIVFKCTLALITYIAFVDTIDDIIIDRLPNHTLREILGLMYCVAIIGSMPIQLNPVSDTIFRTTFLDNLIPIFSRNPTTKYYFGAMISILFCAGIAMMIPNLHTMFNITGSVVGILTIIVFPVMFYNKAYGKEVSWVRWTFHWFLASLVLTTGAVSTVYTVLA
mmetsp:Transcript_24701/g.21935  ORF Transcript_24701/g.21935 Transcript_24701/m.21935 type:complete len:248 (-) Transcript_24701:33-776(-)